MKRKPKCSTEHLKNLVQFLKEKGFSNYEIRFCVTIEVEGLVMAKAIYKFNELYDSGEIDGFPDSSIQILLIFYGNKLKKMKHETILEKVKTLQRTLESDIDEENINEAVEYYLQ